MLIQNIIAFYRGILGHPGNEESAKCDTQQRTQEVNYDDRQSMVPFTQEKERLKSLRRQDTGKTDDNKADDQRDLVKWTRRLAYSTGLLAVATFVVAAFAAWGSIDTRRLADAARDQANVARDTEMRQLRAYP